MTPLLNWLCASAVCWVMFRVGQLEHNPYTALPWLMAALISTGAALAHGLMWWTP